jgi:hypothetical protein
MIFCCDFEFGILERKGKKNVLINWILANTTNFNVDSFVFAGEFDLSIYVI